MSGYTWQVSTPSLPIPANAVEGGRDADGNKIYVGRANMQGEQLACNIVPQKGEAYVSHGNKEHKVVNYEVLCVQKLHWIRNFAGYVPSGAVESGRTLSGEKLYVGKIRHGNSEIVGKVHPSHGCLYIPYNGKELAFKDYDILVFNSNT